VRGKRWQEKAGKVQGPWVQARTFTTHAHHDLRDEQYNAPFRFNEKRSGVQRNEMMNGKTYVDWMLNASWIQIACQVDLSLLSIKSMINIFLLRIYCFSSKQ
jgi:hypothetical protein